MVSRIEVALAVGGRTGYGAHVLGAVLSRGWAIVIVIGIVNNLGLNRNVLDPLIDAFNWLFDYHNVLDFFPDVLDLGLNGVVVGDSLLDRDSFSSDDLVIFYDLVLIGDSIDLFHLVILRVFSLEGNVLYTTLSVDLTSVRVRCVLRQRRVGSLTGIGGVSAGLVGRARVGSQDIIGGLVAR